MAFKKCRNDGCEVLIEVRNTAEGWRPFEESGNKHNCQFSDYAKKQKGVDEKANTQTTNHFLEQKDDHGNESSWNIKIAEALEKDRAISPAEYVERLGYVDHTAKGTSKVEVFFASQPADLTNDYNNFLRDNNGRIRTQGAHDHVTKDDDGMLFSIFLYYEEVK